jgi:hypothetical protein
MSVIDLTAIDLMYKMAERARILSEKQIDALRLEVATAETWGGVLRETRGKTRGALIEEILTDEFEDEAKKIDELIGVS